MPSVRNFGMIRTTIWQSDRFKELETHASMLAYIWLHTSFKVCAGVLRVGPAVLLDEVSFLDNMEHAEHCFYDMERAGLITYVKPFVIIHKYIDQNPIKGFKHAIAAINEVLALPESDAKKALAIRVSKTQGFAQYVHWAQKQDKPQNTLILFYELDYNDLL